MKDYLDPKRSIGVQWSGSQSAKQESFSFEPAGFWLRLFANTYDSFIIGVITVLAVIGLSLVAGASLFSMGENPFESGKFNMLMLGSFITIALLIGALPLICTILFGSAFESSSWRATPGKKLIGLEVCDTQGAQLTFGKALKRNLSKFLGIGIIFAVTVIAAISLKLGGSPVLSALVAVGGGAIGLLIYVVGHLMAAFSEGKQALHDRIADCYITKRDDYPSGRRTFFSIIAVIILIFGSMSQKGKKDKDHERVVWERAGKIQFPFPSSSVSTRSLTMRDRSDFQLTPQTPTLEPRIVRDRINVPLTAVTAPVAAKAQGSLQLQGNSFAVVDTVARVRDNGDSIEIALLGNVIDQTNRTLLLTLNRFEEAMNKTTWEPKVIGVLTLNFKPFSFRGSCDSFALKAYSLVVPDKPGEAHQKLQRLDFDTGKQIGGYTKFRSCKREVGGHISFILSGKHASASNGKEARWSLDILSKL